MQDCSISSALAMEIPQSCTEPSIYYYIYMSEIINIWVQKRQIQCISISSIAHCFSFPVCNLSHMDIKSCFMSFKEPPSLFWCWSQVVVAWSWQGSWAVGMTCVRVDATCDTNTPQHGGKEVHWEKSMIQRPLRTLDQGCWHWLILKNVLWYQAVN